MKIKATVNNLEFRGLEVKQSKKDNSEYMIVKFDDEAAERLEFIDRDMDNKPFYKRATWYDVVLEINITKNFTNVKLVDVKKVNNDTEEVDEDKNTKSKK